MNDGQGRISWNPLICGLAASAADVGLAWCARTTWLRWWDVWRRSELTAGGSSNHLLCRSTASCSNSAEYWWKPRSGFWQRAQTGIEQADTAAGADNSQYDTRLKPVPTSTAGCQRWHRDFVQHRGHGLTMPGVTPHQYPPWPSVVLT